jgi:hypothetical protein
MIRNMKIVSLELAKQLKEAGYLQDNSEFYWVKNDIMQEVIGKYSVIQAHNAQRVPKDIVCAAPLADEILDKLPKGEIYIGVTNTYSIRWVKGRTYIGEQNTTYELSADTLADGSAQMWLYLKKKGLI